MKTYRLREKNAQTRAVEDVKKKIHAIAREVLLGGISDFVWVASGGKRKTGGSKQSLWLRH